MFEELYNFVADIIWDFVYNKYNEGLLRQGERYILQLDNESFVTNVYNALSKKDYVEPYLYKNGNNDLDINEKYTMKKIKFPNTDICIVVIPQNNGVEDAFLTTMRNYIKHDMSLLLVYSPNDSILTTCENLASSGQPFSYENLYNRIRNTISARFKNEKTTEKVLLWALDRIKTDRYSNNSSIWIYKDIIKILKASKLEKSHYNDLHLFYDSGIDNYNLSNIEKELDENHKEYEALYELLIDDNFEDNKLPYSKEINKEICKYNGHNMEEIVSNIDFNDIKSFKDEIKKSSQAVLLSYDEMSLLDKGTVIFRKSSDNTYEIICYPESDKDIVELRIPINQKVEFDFKSTNVRSINGIVTKDTPISVEIKRNKLCIQLFTDHKCSFYDFSIKQKHDTKRFKYINFHICILFTTDKILSEIHNSFSIAENKIVISRLGASNILKINSNKNNDVRKEVIIDGDVVNCKDNEVLLLQFKNENIPESGQVEFKVNVGNICIPLMLDLKNDESEISSAELFKIKFEHKKSLICQAVKDGDKIQKILITSPETGAQLFAESNLESLLVYEYIMVYDECPYLIIDDSNTAVIQKGELNYLNDTVKQAYKDYVIELRKCKTLPSLAYYEDGEDLTKYAMGYINTIKNYLSKCPEEILPDEYKDCLRVGCVSLKKECENIEFFSPLHPLNVAYQFLLQNEEGVESIRDDFIPNLTPTRLVPFIKDEQNSDYHYLTRNTEFGWCEYAKLRDSQYSVAQNTVPKIICDKIEKYIENFKYLFDDELNNELRITLSNMGNCYEVLQGIINFYKKKYIDKRVDNDICLNIKIYVLIDSDKDDSANNVFNYLDSHSYLENFLAKCKIKKNIDDLVDMLAEHLKCYFIDKDHLAYSHLCFVKMRNDNTLSHGKYSNTNSGCMLDGIISSVVPSVTSSYYKVGFGTKKLKCDNNLISLAKSYNSIYTVLGDGSEYDKDSSLYSKIDIKNDRNLDTLYKYANWVVFIEPEVDSKFFNQSNELMIIHYSDRYSNTSIADDITVSTEVEQYKKTIVDRLKSEIKNIDLSGAEKLIKMFNALNGSWLLSFISCLESDRDKDVREKFSLLAATNMGLAFLSSIKDIVWVPVAMEPVLVVTTKTGLSEKDSLLSIRNLKAGMGTEDLNLDTSKCSDDLLFVGIENPDMEDESGNLNVYFYPIEVKASDDENSAGGKWKDAKTQLKSAYSIYESVLDFAGKRNDINTKITRNLFMQLIISNSEKMDTYGIDKNMHWEYVYDKFRQRLLDGKYIFNNLNISGSKGAGMMFIKHTKNPQEDENFLRMEFSNIAMYEALEFCPYELKLKYFQKGNIENKEI